MLKGQELGHNVAVQLARHVRVGKQGLYFGGEDHPLGRSMDIERLDPELVAGDEQAARVPVVPGKSEHPAHAPEGIDSPLVYCREDDFGIAGGAKSATQRFQQRAQIAVVENCAVEDHHPAPVLAEQRLVRAGVEIVDAQAPSAERQRPLDELSAGVGASMDQGGEPPLQPAGQPGLSFGAGRQFDSAHDSAHFSARPYNPRRNPERHLVRWHVVENDGAHADLGPVANPDIL